MNKIVVEHYPVSRLPEDLREGFGRNVSVRVTLEADTTVVRPLRPVSARDLVAQLQAEKAGKVAAEGISLEDAVSRIGELRNEWED